MKKVFFAFLLIAYSHCGFGQSTRGASIENSGQVTDSGTTYAWIVGISHYQNIPALQYADSDALLFKSFLQSANRGGIQRDNILEMYNERATGNALIVRGLYWIDTRAYHQGDKLYIYLAGHGDAIDKDDYFFLGSDIETGSPGAKNNYMAGSSLQMYNLKMKIKKITARGVQVYLIIDACRTNEQNRNNLDGKYSEGITELREGEIMMFSASPGQSALESNNIGGGHGLFTWYLVGGLSGEADKNGDGKISLFELKNYVEEKVSFEANTRFNAHEQFPFFCCSEVYSKTISRQDTGLNYFWSAKNKKQDIGMAYADNVKRTYEQDTIADKEKLLYSMFNDAIIMNHLTGDSSAGFFYDNFRKRFPRSAAVNEMRVTLATEYMNFAQDKINIYLRGKDQVAQRVYNSQTIAGYEYRVSSELPYKEAAEMIKNAITLLNIKDDSLLIKKMKNKYYFLLSNSYFQEDASDGIKLPALDLDRAIDTIKAAIRHDTSASYLYNTLGNLYKEKAEFDSAEKAYSHAITLAPDWSFSYNNLGAAYHTQKKYDKAESEYIHALKIDSSYAVAYNSLGNLYNDEMKYGEAEKYYKKAIKADSNFSYAGKNLNTMKQMQDRKSKLAKGTAGVQYHTEQKTATPIRTIPIDVQQWAAVNLNTAYYRNGDKIKEAVTPEEWSECDSLHVGCWCYYKNAAADAEQYGKLYNWYAVNDKRGLAPDGYHVPNSREVNEMINFIGRDVAGRKLKGKERWLINGAGTDDYKWAAFPAGWRDNEGIFEDEGYSGYFWSSDMIENKPAYFHFSYNKDRMLFQPGDQIKPMYTSFGRGFSVRCVKNQQ